MTDARPSQDRIVDLLEGSEGVLHSIQNRLEAGEEVPSSEQIAALADFAMHLRHALVLLALDVDRMHDAS